MKIFFSIIFVCFVSISVAGQNWVINPSFEDAADCPMLENQFEFALGWTNYGDSADYFNSCSPGWSEFTIPQNRGGFQLPYSGIAYAALRTYAPYNNNSREFIGSPLISPLTVGTKYFVTMRTSLSISPDIYSYVATNKLGIKFSMNSYTPLVPITVTNVAQIYSDSVITDTTGWTLISGSFIADSAYTHIIIGNHFDDSNTTAIIYYDTLSSFAYYYIDDICVSTDSITCNPPLGMGIEPNIIRQLVYPNPATDYSIIEFENASHLNCRLTLYDCYGRQVLVKEHIFSNLVRVERNQLLSGTYFFILRSEEKVLAKGKLTFN